ncbi:MAG: AbrB/MazE/SpoVT family DNA-binding domain-containing protein [Catonella sp.]|nr:AbrB/MazE/SpoVT family DNA-binding domain-containing protein [Catonella sp.]MDY6355790.1 AbrB/MazE/SpoVT family DNA-binding domain-containing protein [Catonella sp.]
MNDITEITSMSSKGMVMIPKDIRESMTLNEGIQFVIITDGENILLKPIRKPTLEDFRKSMAESQKWAKEVGLTEDDIYDAIRTVRRKKHADENCN